MCLLRLFVCGGGVGEEGRSSDFSEKSNFPFSRSLYSAKNKKPKQIYGEFPPASFYFEKRGLVILPPCTYQIHLHTPRPPLTHPLTQPFCAIESLTLYSILHPIKPTPSTLLSVRFDWWTYQKNYILSYAHKTKSHKRFKESFNNNIYQILYNESRTNCW